MEGVDFKYNNFFKFLTKYTQIRHFWSQIYKFSFLHQSLQLEKLEGTYFIYDNSIFKFQPKKYPNKANLVVNLRILYPHEILVLENFEAVDFKYDNGFFKFQPKNTQIKQ